MNYKTGAGIVFLIILCAGGCTSNSAPPPPIPFSGTSTASASPTQIGSSQSESIPQASDADRVNALRLVKKAEKAYATGDYADAEALLKESISLYPFVPMANLLLGKIFLIKGSASRDYTLINSARLMFEMALALDPQLEETITLMELFGSRSFE